MPRKLLVGGVQRNGSVKGIKKVSPPSVPTLTVKAAQFKKSPCICNGDDQLTVELCDLDDYGSYSKPPISPSNGTQNYNPPFCNFSQQSHPMKKMTPGGGSNGQIHLAHVIVHSQPDSLPSTPSDTSHSPCLSKGRLISGTQASLDDPGIDMNSPGRHSPGGSSGGSSISRHSLSSLDSGRASAPGSEGKVVNRRLSIQSYEGSSPQRRSYHSSSSSIASVGDDLGPGPNVAEMVLHGLPDVEVLSSWLATLHFEEYIPMFLLAGYDMPTITRMTPEDLTAIGITKPNHRRKLKAEIAKLNISDGIPEFKPDSLMEWLQLLRLEDYFDTLCRQNYDTIDKVTDLTWEDLEDIGIQKLGHQKRILLAIKRIEDINHGRRPNLYPQSNMQKQVGYPGSGSSTFPRPSTLNNVHPVHYTSQEIAISTYRPKSSPSTDSIPEMKTFQQSPLREENLFLQAVHNSAHHMTSQHHNGIAHKITSPTRVRSLESLNSENIINNVNHSLQQQFGITEENTIPNPNHCQQQPPVPTTLAQQPPPQLPNAATAEQLQASSKIPCPKSHGPAHGQNHPNKNWQVTDLDTDYECEGTATLNRPKGMVKLRPMAKIAAKTREEIAEAIMDIPDSEFKSLINQTRTLDVNQTRTLDVNQTRTLDGWSSLDGSPRHGPSTVPRSATLKRAPPPPPPKRNNATAKGDKSQVETNHQELNGAITKPNGSAKGDKFNSAKGDKSQVETNHQELNGAISKPSGDQMAKANSKYSKEDSEDFPPPPSPLPSAVEKSGLPSAVVDKSGKTASSPEASSERMDELFNNPLFRQRRKDSSESASSLDSSAMPFANETVGTIKQKSSRPYPSMPIGSSQSSQSRAQNFRNASDNSSMPMDHEYDVTPEAVSPGDVIDDIENMLANLSNQLDAMLDEEVQK